MKLYSVSYGLKEETEIEKWLKFLHKIKGSYDWHHPIETVWYKCQWLGIKLIFAPQFYASSRYCSHCGCYHNDNLTLADREWTCPVCGCHHDRDANAAVNLKFYGQWLAGLVQTDENVAARLAVGGCSADACPSVYQKEGVTFVSPRDRRLQFFLADESCRTMKQELNSMNSLT